MKIVKRLFFIVTIAFFMNTASFADDILDSINVSLVSWTYDYDMRLKKVVPIDTSINNINLFGIYDYNNTLYAWKGFQSSAAYPILFNERTVSNDFQFDLHYLMYHHTKENIKYYKTNVPFSQFEYSFFPSGKEYDEQAVYALYTQNVSKELNVGFDIKYIGAKGHYEHQGTHMGSYNVFSSYQNKRYNYHLSASYQKYDVQQNGGIKSVEDFLKEHKEEPPVVNLKDPKSETKKIEVLFTQEFNFMAKLDSMCNDSVTVYDQQKPYAGLFQTTKVYSNYRKFWDERVDASEKEYYDTLLRPTALYDSVMLRGINNTLGIKFSRGVGKNLALNGNGGLVFELQHYYTGTDTNTIKGVRSSMVTPGADDYINLGYNYNVVGRFRKFYLAMGGYQFVSGYKKGDKEINFDFTQDVSIKNRDLFSVHARAEVGEKNNSYFLNTFYSGRVRFDNADNADRKRMTYSNISGDLTIKDWGVKLEAFYNYADFYPLINDTLEVDYLNNVNVVGLVANTDHRIWKFNLKNKASIQAAENRIKSALAIPDFAIKSTLLFDHRFYFKATQGGFRMQLGADMMYTSKYNAYSYTPFYDQFYRGEARNLGEYFFITPFLNFQLKKVRAFLIYNNVLWLRTQQKAPAFFTVKDYPHDMSLLKIGINWTFYD